MQVTIKTLQNSVFKITSDLEVTVSQLKQKIEEYGKQDEYPISRQKLIFQGKILDDEKTLAEYNLTEKGFIVLMLVKPKPETKTQPPKVESTKQAETVSPAPQPSPQETKEESTPEEPVTPPVAVPFAASPPARPTSPTQPANPFSDELIQNISVMGFPRDQVIAALRAAFGNPERAVEYLMNGIPDHLAPQQVQESTPAPAGQVATETAAPTSNPQEFGNLDRIRNEPQFQQIRQIIRTNPHLLQQFIQQMSRDNPTLFQEISGNQEAFIRMLNEPDDAEPAQGAPAAGPHITREQDGRVTLQVTEAERQAIDRLKQLGFPEDLVIQAYFACDKNEELAANFLLSNAFD